MGRPLFSLQYNSAPTICEEQDPAAASLDIPCERWSAWNQFDPDSEEFFKDATLEHFVDGPVSPNWSVEGENVDEAPHVVVLENVTESSPSPSITSSTTGGGTFTNSSDSPIAVGASDLTTIVAGVYTPVDWQQRFLEAGSEPRRQSRSTRNNHRGPRRIGVTRQHTSSGDSNSLNTHRVSPISVFIPPAPHRASPIPVTTSTSRAQEVQQLNTGTPRSSVSRRTVNITPINIPSEPSLPSPISPSTPTTLVPNITSVNTNNLITPSPAPNTTPRIYSWSRFPAPASPSRESPLTNPRARLSHGRIDTMSMSLAQHQYGTPVPVFEDRIYY